MKKQLFFLILFGVSVFYAQDKDFQKWLQEDQGEFSEYLSQEDKEFSEFLKQEWKKFNIEKPVKEDILPRYKVPPVAKPKAKAPTPIKPVKDAGNVELKPTKPSPKTEDVRKNIEEEMPEEPKEEIESPTPAREPDLNYEEINYFGRKTEMILPRNGVVHLAAGNLDNNKISEFYEKLASTNYKPSVQKALEDKSKFHLNDWAYVLYLNDYAKKIYPNNANERHLFVWFYLLKSGYKARIAIVNNEARLLVNVKDKIFGVPYLVADNAYKEYIINLDDLRDRTTGSLLTYKKDFPNAENLVSMQLPKVPQLSNQYVEREIKFIYNNEERVIKVPINKSLIDLYANYPQTDLPVYFNAAKDNVTANALTEQLRPYVSNLNKVDAVNFLLSFVQNSFRYKTDQQQFGYEKPFFLEETMYYPYIDCEDRSVLFGFLVKKLLNLKVIGINYPGHVTTAVDLGEDNTGYVFKINGKTYTICDPTYINATVGMCMPEYQNAKVEKIINID